jgi:hypothetical protein
LAVRSRVVAGEHESTCARRSFSRELLVTTKAELAAEPSAAIAQACASASWVRVAYVCRVRRTYDDGAVREPLATFVIADPPPEERLTTGRQRTELLASLPDPMPDGGISVLADAAVPEVRRHGICVYERD